MLMGVGWGCVCPHGKVGRQRWERRGVRPGIGDRPVSTDGGVRDVTTVWRRSDWVESGIGELNPCHQLGKLGHGRYTNPASNRHQHFSRIAAHDKSDRHCLGEIGVVPRPSDLQPGDQRGKGCIS